MQAQYQNSLLPHIRRQILVKNLGLDFIKTYKCALMIDSHPELYPPLARVRYDNRYTNTFRKMSIILITLKLMDMISMKTGILIK